MSALTPEERDREHRDLCELRRAVAVLANNPADAAAKAIVDQHGERFGLTGEVGGVPVLAILERDPLQDLGAVARGDVAAQRRLSLYVWCMSVVTDPATGELVINPASPDAYEMLEAALMLSRLAAAHGHNEDNSKLVHRLAIAASLQPESATERVAEAIAWTQRAAEAGNEDAADALNLFAEESTAEAMALAKGFSERLNKHLPIDGMGAK